MCSFLVASLSLLWRQGILDYANHLQKSRGPDGTVQLRFGDFQLLHNLLSLTGQQEAAKQPFVKGMVALLFNGQVYNYQDLAVRFAMPTPSTDGEVLLPLYLRLGSTFASRLSGEFAICIVDLRQPDPLIILVADAFATKPLWWATGQASTGRAGFAVASYRSPVLRLGLETQLQRLDANTALVLRLLPGGTAVEMFRHSIMEFDLRQFKSHTDDWARAFEAAVVKRLRGLNGSNGRAAFVPLSSGYDSGALQLAVERLLAQGSLPERQLPHFVAVRAAEDSRLLSQRLNRTESGILLRLDRGTFARAKRKLHAIERPWSALSELTPRFLADTAAIALGCICNLSRLHGWRVLLSGHGADEVMGSYGRLGPGPQGGRVGVPFPSKLGSIFPWRDFFGGAMHDFLMKEELVTGSFGLEGRYPFLDVSVVQEYLWLSPGVKNRWYKAALHNYFTSNAFPFGAGVKRGFHGAKGLRLPD